MIKFNNTCIFKTHRFLTPLLYVQFLYKLTQLMETHNFYFCVTPKNQALHRPTVHFPNACNFRLSKNIYFQKTLTHFFQHIRISTRKSKSESRISGGLRVSFKYWTTHNQSDFNLIIRTFGNIGFKLIFAKFHDNFRR